MIIWINLNWHFIIIYQVVVNLQGINHLYSHQLHRRFRLHLYNFYELLIYLNIRLGFINLIKKL
jgi:hypothetical protein